MATRRRDALVLCREGTRRLVSGDVSGALQLYRESLQLFPTAEAYTHRGWAYSREGRLNDAIVECRMAIATDPRLGNAYNDLGAYLAALGYSDEAISWFEKAKTADRYLPRHFPFRNLGRLYARRGHLDLAAAEFEQVLQHRPDDPVATAFLEQHPLRPN